MTERHYTTSSDQSVNGAARDPHAPADAHSTYGDLGFSIDDLFAWAGVLNHLAQSPDQLEGAQLCVIGRAINSLAHDLDASREAMGRLALGLTMQQQHAARAGR